MPKSDTNLIVIVDVDGTLVDTNYQHAIAWHRAFHDHDHRVQVWEIHRHIGMGGDQIVAALVGDEAEQDEGDSIREAEANAYSELIGEVQALHGASELLSELHEDGATVILASSAKPDEVDHYLDLLDARDLVDGWTSAGDVEQTKPEPDLIEVALEKANALDKTTEAAPKVMIGDSTWDIKAAQAADVPTLAVLTGGFSAEELREAGASEVVESIGELRKNRGLLGKVAQR